MPSSHLPQNPCNKFVYDFPYDFLGIVGGYGLRHMRSHYLRASCDFFYGASGANPYRDCAEIVQKSCNVSAVAVQSPHPPHGNRTEPMRGSAFGRCPCRDCATYLRHVYGLRAYDFFKFVKLLAKPNRRGCGARESVRKSHNRRTERGIRTGYGLRGPIARQMWTRHNRRIQ